MADENGPTGNYLRSLERVRRFLERFHGRTPCRSEIRGIAPDLATLFDKFSKIRRTCPASRRIDLSEELWNLLDLAGIASRGISPLRKAASS